MLRWVTRGACAAMLVAVFARDVHAQPAEPLPPPPPPPPTDPSHPPPPVQPPPHGGARPLPGHGGRAPVPPPAPAPPPAAPTPAPAPSPAPVYEAPEPVETNDRALGGHTFPIPAFQDSAFVLSNVGLRQGFVWKNIPNLPAGRMGTLSISTSGITQNAEAGVRFTDWLGLTLTGGGYVLTGSNVRSLVGFGGEYQYGGSVGLAARIVRVDKTKTYLGAHVKARLASGRLLSERALVDAILQNPPGNPSDVANGQVGNTLFTPTTTTAFTGSINVAQALSRGFGLQAELAIAFLGTTNSPYEIGQGRAVDEHITTTVPSASIALDLDANTYRVPLAVMLEYSIRFPHAKDETSGTIASQTEHVLALGAYYAGRRDLQIGGVASAQLAQDPVFGASAAGATALSGSPTAYTFELVGRYVW